MNPRVMTVLGVLPTLLGTSCTTDPPESDTAPAASEENKELKKA